MRLYSIAVCVCFPLCISSAPGRLRKAYLLTDRERLAEAYSEYLLTDKERELEEESELLHEIEQLEESIGLDNDDNGDVDDEFSNSTSFETQAPTPSDRASEQDIVDVASVTNDPSAIPVDPPVLDDPRNVNISVTGLDDGTNTASSPAPGIVSSVSLGSDHGDVDIERQSSNATSHADQVLPTLEPNKNVDTDGSENLTLTSVDLSFLESPELELGNITIPNMSDVGATNLDVMLCGASTTSSNSSGPLCTDPASNDTITKSGDRLPSPADESNLTAPVYPQEVHGAPIDLVTTETTPAETNFTPALVVAVPALDGTSPSTTSTNLTSVAPNEAIGSNTLPNPASSEETPVGYGSAEESVGYASSSAAENSVEYSEYEATGESHVETPSAEYGAPEKQLNDYSSNTASKKTPVGESSITHSSATWGQSSTGNTSDEPEVPSIGNVANQDNTEESTDFHSSQTDDVDSEPSDEININERANKTPQEVADMAEAKALRIMEDKYVPLIVITMSLLSTAFTLMVAQQMIENPNGMLATLCRCMVAVTRIITFPLRYLLCSGCSSGARSRIRDRRTHEILRNRSGEFS